MTLKISLGKRGEQLVALYLERQGFCIREINYSHRCGEIDIIAEKDDVRAFVEVKLRRSHYFALSEVITQGKQRKIVSTALLYNSKHPTVHPMIYRFDVALVEPEGNDYAINYIPNAFTQESGW